MKTIKSKVIWIAAVVMLFGYSACNEDDDPVDMGSIPVAAFEVSSEEVEEGTAVVFTDVSFDQDGEITAWLWDFGNGETSEEQNPSKTLPLGEHTVTLQVTDNDGNSSENEFSKVITVLEPSTATTEPTTLWMFDLPAVIEDSSPAVGNDNTIYIGCNGKEGLANVFAVKDGSEVWSYETGDIVRSAPTISDDGSTIYLGSYDNNLYGFNAASGDVTLQFDMGNNAKYSGPALGSDGTIYIGCQTDELIAVNSDGTEGWRYDTGGDVNSTPIVGASGVIYVGSTGDDFFAFNPDGTVKWQKTYGGWTATAAAIAEDGTIYFAGEGNVYDEAFGGIVVAYNAADGSEKWHTNMTSKVNQGGPAIGPDGTIYVGGHDQKLFALNPADGTIRWEYGVNGNILATPAVDNDGNIYVTDDSGFLHVVAPDGTKKWKEKQLGVKIWSSPTIAPDGTIYVAADQAGETGKLYAIQTNATGLATSAWPMRSKNASHTGRF